MIVVNSNSLHARWFIFWAQCWAQFTDGRTPGGGGQTSLCVYFWTCVGAPALIVALHIATGVFMLYATIYHPIGQWSLMGYMSVLMTIAVAVFFCWGMYAARCAFRNRAIKPQKDGASLITLTGKYIMAAKHRVCPIIKIGELS